VPRPSLATAMPALSNAASLESTVFAPLGGTCRVTAMAMCYAAGFSEQSAAAAQPFRQRRKRPSNRR